MDTLFSGTFDESPERWPLKVVDALTLLEWA